MSAKENSLVSVIIPCHNDGHFIMEAIESVRQQTYSPIEVIIIDDGSEDENTKRILEQIKFPRLKLLHTTHGYPALARNKGIKQASGEYFLPLDADDRIEPTYIEKAVDVMKLRSDVAAVYCHANYFGAKEGPWQLPEFDINEMLIDNVVFVTALIRKKAWEDAGGFDTSFQDGLEDYDFFLSILESEWNIYQLPEYLFNYRIRISSRSAQFVEKKEAFAKTYQRLYQKHFVLYQKHMDTLFPALRERYLQTRNQGKHAEQEAGLLLNLVYEKGLRALARLLFYRYKGRKGDVKHGSHQCDRSDISS